MKILLVTNYQPPHMGGIEFAGEALKACWERDGHQVTWLSTDLPRGARPSGGDNVRVRAANFAEDWFQINTPLVSPLARPRIRQALCAHEVVNVHSLAPGLSTLVLRAALRARKPLVVTQHVGVIPLRIPLLGRLQHLLICREARRAAAQGAPITFVGAAVRDWFLQHAGLAPEQTLMTPAGIDPAAYAFVPDADRAAARAKWNLAADRLNVLFVGRFYDKKGLPLLREAAAACPGVQFTLVGSGPHQPAAWGLPNVRVIGFVSTAELRELYGAHDLFLMPSYGEGWPAVVPQAMACGLACVVSEECFQGYARDPERFVVIPRTADALARVLRQAAQDALPLRHERESLSRYALATWDWQRTARIYTREFERLLRRREQP